MSKKNNLSLRKKQHEFELRREQQEKEKKAKKLNAKKNKMKMWQAGDEKYLLAAHDLSMVRSVDLLLINGWCCCYVGTFKAFHTACDASTMLLPQGGLKQCSLSHPTLESHKSTTIALTLRPFLALITIPLRHLSPPLYHSTVPRPVYHQSGNVCRILTGCKGSHLVQNCLE